MWAHLRLSMIFGKKIPRHFPQEKCIEAFENGLLYKLVYIRIYRSSRPKIHGFSDIWAQVKNVHQ